MFGLLKKRGGETANKISGRTDLLEACCAAAVLTSMADGDVSKAEVALLPQTIAANETLSKAFTTPQINAAVQKQVQRASAGMSGKRALWKEIEDIVAMGDSDAAETVVVVALDIASADGSIGEKERATLDKIAATLGVNLQALMDL